MKKTRDRPYRFALGPFAAARSAEEKVGVIFHGGHSLYSKGRELAYLQIHSQRKKLRGPNDFGLWRGRDGFNVYSSASAIETHLTVHEGEDGVVPTEADIFTGQKLRPTLAHDDVASDDQLAPKFFHTKPFADAVASVLNAALSFFVSHWKKLRLRF